ncbi:MAG: hypothetical protein AAF682_17840 [Planctomycetota bacterium]
MLAYVRSLPACLVLVALFVSHAVADSEDVCGGCLASIQDVNPATVGGVQISFLIEEVRSGTCVDPEDCQQLRKCKVKYGIRTTDSATGNPVSQAFCINMAEVGPSVAKGSLGADDWTEQECSATGSLGLKWGFSSSSGCKKKTFLEAEIQVEESSGSATATLRCGDCDADVEPGGDPV